jgi:hypothetical protein
MEEIWQACRRIFPWLLFAEINLSSYDSKVRVKKRAPSIRIVPLPHRENVRSQEAMRLRACRTPYRPV